MLLDRSRKYFVRTPDECIWKFQYESVSTLEGYKSDWKAYRRRTTTIEPHRNWVWQSQGKYPEIEVLHKLQNYCHVLDDDDKLNLMVFLYGDNGKHFDAFLEQTKQEMIETGEWKQLKESD